MMFELPVKKEAPFRDRDDAGLKLAEKLVERNIEADLVMAIPRGGVPVGERLAEKLGIPLDLLIVKKLQVPGNPEAGFGAVTSDGTLFLNERLIRQLNISNTEVRVETDRQEREARRSSWVLRQGRPLPEIDNKRIILVDDGLATGYSMLAAVDSLKRFKAKKIIVAVPTSQAETYEMIKRHADNVIALDVSSNIPYAVADAYEFWWDLTDKEALKHLKSWQTKTKHS